MNGVRLHSVADLTALLRNIAHVHSITFKSSHRREFGPERDTREQADEDLQWLRARCVPQMDLQSEFAQAGMLLGDLRSQRCIAMPAPLHVSDELRELVSTHLQPRKRAQVVFYHWFSPEADCSTTDPAHRPSNARATRACAKTGCACMCQSCSLQE